MEVRKKRMKLSEQGYKKNYVKILAVLFEQGETKQIWIQINEAFFLIVHLCRYLNVESKNISTE